MKPIRLRDRHWLFSRALERSCYSIASFMISPIFRYNRTCSGSINRSWPLIKRNFCLKILVPFVLFFNSEVIRKRKGTISKHEIIYMWVKISYWNYHRSCFCQILTVTIWPIGLDRIRRHRLQRRCYCGPLWWTTWSLWSYDQRKWKYW